jgi:hypothetical protein
MNIETIHTDKIGISLPETIVKKIDELRGDIPRSRYIFRLLELAFQAKEGKA